MTRVEKLLIALFACGWLCAAVSDWTVSGTVTVTPPDGARGVVINADTSSPAYAPLYLSPQDTAPSSCSVGDLAVVVNELQICTAANTWTVVGSQS